MYSVLKSYLDSSNQIKRYYKNRGTANLGDEQILAYVEACRVKGNINKTIILSLFVIIISIASVGSPSIRIGEGSSFNLLLLVISVISLVVYMEVADHYAKINLDEYAKSSKLVNKVRRLNVIFWAAYFIGISFISNTFGTHELSGTIFWFALLFIVLVVPTLIASEKIALAPFFVGSIYLYFSTISMALNKLLVISPVFLIIIFVSQLNHLERMCTYFDAGKNIVESGANKRRLANIFDEVFDLAFELDVKRNKCDILRKSSAYDFLSDGGMTTEQVVEAFCNATYEEDRVLCTKNFNLDYLNNEFLLGRTQVYFEVRLNTVADHYKWVSVLITREETETDSGNIFLCLIQDVEERKKNENKLRLEAEKDPLTQLYNKVTTRSMIEECFEKNYTQQHALIIIDIDNFKTINDTRGHVIGDQILLAFSEELNKSFRESDIIGRTGGDEFIVLIKNVQSIALVCDKLQRLTSSFKKYGIDNGFPGRLSTSIGVAMFNKDGMTYEELFKKADAALYEAKRNGKDQYKFSITRS